MEIHARNTNDLQSKVYQALLTTGRPASSRNGDVLYFDQPVSICLSAPWERVNMCSVRDANPFFHLWEALAMIGDFNSVGLMKFFASNMANFSDDGNTYNAFYGTRARSTWGDQLDEVVNQLQKDPASRQAVVNLWDPADLTKITKDKACNLMLLFSVDPVTQELKMTSFNRSNDAIWGGVNGANIVHLSFFQEYVACGLGRRQGPWWHISNNLHVYTANAKWEQLRNRAVDEASVPDEDTEVVCGPLLFEDKARGEFDAELYVLLRVAERKIRTGMHTDGIFIPDGDFDNAFLKTVAIPMFNAFIAHKVLRSDTVAHEYMEQVSAPDWRLAGQRWLNRRDTAPKMVQSTLPLNEGHNP